MKPKSSLRSFLLAVGSSLLAICSASAQSDLFWDANGNTTTATGGTGNWPATNTWRSGSGTGTLGNWADNNDAHFAGTAGTVTINSGTISARSVVVDTASYIIAGSGTSNTLTINGATADHGFFINQSATISAVIAGSNGLIKRGNGILSLTSDSNNFTGTIKVTAGQLRVASNNGRLGNTANGIEVSSGAQLFLGDGAPINTSTRAMTINGNGSVDNGTFWGSLRLDNGSTVGGTITLAGNSRIGGPSFGGAVTNTISGKITGGFNVDFFGATTTTNGSVTMVLSNTGNDYTGTTTISNGAYGSNALTSRTNLRLGASNVIPNGANAGNVVFALSGSNNASTVALDLSGFSETINGLTVNAGAFTSRITNSSTSVSSTLTVGDNNTTSAFSGIIEDSNATNNLRLTKIGTGTLTLSGASNTYRGVTTVSGGVLKLDNAGALSGSSNLTMNGGVLGLNHSTNFTRGLGTAGNQAQWTGSGGFAAYTADRTVNLGGAAGTVTWNSGSFVPTGSNLILGAADATHTLIFANPIALASAQRTIQVNNGSATVDARLTGALTGTGSSGLNKTGTGTLEIAGAASYAGATTITAGTLQVSSTGSIGGSGITIESGATFRYNSSTTLTVGITNNGGSVTGSGNLGGLTLSGSGSIDPGNSPGIMTAAATNPTGGLAYNFELTGAANSSPVWSNAGASVNDVLRLTSGSPFINNLTSANVITIYLGVTSLTLGDIFTGGFFTDNSADFLASVQNATFQYFLSDTLGTTDYLGNKYTEYTGPLDFLVSTSQVGSANFAGGTVTGGYVTQFTVIPEPGAALLGGLGLLALLRRRR